MREERFIEIDIARGIALSMMIFLHLMWDLDFFKIYPLNNDIYQLNKIVAFMFLFLVGICLSITSKRKTPLQQLKRGLGIFNIGIGLTIISMFVMPERPIVFGVLHCIGLSIILSIPLLKTKQSTVYMHCIVLMILGLLCCIAGLILDNVVIVNPSVPQLIIGLHQQEIWRHTIDYFPLLPWFGVVVTGISMGTILYREGKRQFIIPDFIQKKSPIFLSYLGKHSLYVYLLHQPVLVGFIKYVLPVIRPFLNF